MSQNTYAKLQEIGKTYSILYVEDDEAIQGIMSSILTLFCHALYKARNGQEGLELFNTLKPDLVITDISMPIMDGITMVRHIREKDKETPIMVNSAFSDQNYLMDSIYLGVDRYTIKPIRQDEFLDALYFLFSKLKNKDEAKLYTKIRLQERVNYASSKMIQAMMEIYPNPVLVYTDDGRLYGINSSATLLFNIVSISDENQHETIEASFVHEEGFEHSLRELVTTPPHFPRIKVKTKQGIKIYTVTKNAIEAEEFGRLFCFTFTDITRLEYEKQKSQNLSLFLREQLAFKKEQKKAFIKHDTSKEPLHVKASEKPVPHYASKKGAKEYLSELDTQITEEIAEMDALEVEIFEALSTFEETGALSSLHFVATGLGHYSKTIGALMDFEDIALSLRKLSNLLLELSHTNFNRRKFHLVLEGILADLKQWRRTLFITQEATNIHYLDTSLLSSCLQIETEFFGAEHLKEEELDLF